MGLNPLNEPLRRGPYYILHATDPRGIEMRVVADAQLGDILSVTPAQRSNTANYTRGPRIIHVPQAGDRDPRANSRASVNERDEPDVGNDDDDAEPAAPPQYGSRRRLRHRRASKRRPRRRAGNSLPKRNRCRNAAATPRRRRASAAPY